MRKLLASFACVILFSAAAVGADLPVKAKPLAAEFNWTGFYVGAQAG